MEKFLEALQRRLDKNFEISISSDEKYVMIALKAIG